MSAAPLVQRVDDRNECESWQVSGEVKLNSWFQVCTRIFANGLGGVYGPSLSSRFASSPSVSCLF